MTQGPVKHSQSGQKREPIPKAVSPGGASQIGQVLSTRAQSTQLYEGKGYKAPNIGSATHPSGSQGKHK